MDEDKDYFKEFHKGELGDLRSGLLTALSKRNSYLLKSAMTQIISAMTMGVDVSGLFPDVIMSSITNDLVTKKMVYLYISHYASDNESLALLAMNNFIRDCSDDSPMVRGLALRNFTSLRTPSLVEEHILPALKNGLLDVSPYVRKEACLGCAKIFNLLPEHISPGIINRIYELLKDNDPSVIINSVYTLNELLRDQGGISITKKLILHLLSKMKLFDEWGRSVVLDLFSKYTPGEDEIVTILSILDPFLETRNIGILLGVIKLFINFTEGNPGLHRKVFTRIKTPLINALLGLGTEGQYVILKHVKILLELNPSLFNDDIYFLMLRVNDPDYLKLLKIEMMGLIVNQNVVEEILRELYAAGADRSIEVSKAAIIMIGHVCSVVPAASVLSLKYLLSYLDLEQIPHIIDTAIVSLKDAIRVYPHEAESILPHLTSIIHYVIDEQALCSLIYLIGEHSNWNDDCPYILENIIGKYSTLSNETKNQLIVSSLKLFFKRPLEMKPILSKLLETGMSDYQSPDVNERIIWYFLLLKTDVEETKRIIFDIPPDVVVSDTRMIHEIDLLLEEFNTLSVIYGYPSHTFIRQYEPTEISESSTDEDETDDVKAEGLSSPQEVNFTPEEYNHIMESAALQLDPEPQISPQDFEKIWKSLPIGFQFQKDYSGELTEASDLAEHFKDCSMKVIAKGKAGASILKFFLYAQEEITKSNILLEVLVDTDKCIYGAKLKCDSVEIGSEFKIIFEEDIMVI